MFWCRHVWKVAEKIEHPSFIEAVTANGSVIRALEDIVGHERPVIVTYRCEKCGTEKVERI